MSDRRDEQEDEGGAATDTVKKVKRPPLFKVLLHNDDYTTQDFVVLVLQSIFHHSSEQAYTIMLHVHTRGVGVAGLFPFEIAEAKSHEVMRLAKTHEYPLKCSVEEE